MTWLLLSLSLALPAVAGPKHQLSLFETTPVETSLDHADIPEAWEVWVDRIDGAQTRVDLSHFYVAPKPADQGGPGEGRLAAVLAAIDRATERGVTVRFIVDATFRGSDQDALAALDAHPGVELRRIDLDAVTGGVQHAKYMIVDGQRVLVGSQNFDWRSLEHVQELGVEIDHPGVVAAYTDVFESDWALAGGSDTPVVAADADPGPFKVAFDGKAVKVTPALSPEPLLPDAELFDLPQILDLIAGAKQRVRVQVMSYKTKNYDKTEFKTLDEALRAAAARGVQVELIVSHWSQSRSRLPALRSLHAVDGIEVRFATIPAHSSGFIPFARTIHSKYMVVDGKRAWVGTSNWSGDYFTASRNMGLVVDGKAFAQRLDGVFESLWDSEYAAPVDPDREYERPRIAN